MAALDRRVAPDGRSSGGHVRVQLLAGFVLQCGGEPVALSRNGERVLALLALSEQPLARAYVAGTLWGDVSEQRSAGNLRTALWRMRRPECQVVDASASHLRLAAGVRVDLRDSLALARDLTRAGARPTDGVRTPRDRTGGTGAEDGRDPGGGVGDLTVDLLPGWYEDWVVEWQERWHHLRLHALEALADRFAALGCYAEAVEAAQAAVRGDPLRDSAHRSLVRVHLAEGNRADALREYRTYRQRLSDELHVHPSPQMEHLVADLTSA